MARGFPGDYICTIRVEPVPRNDGRPPLSFPLVSSRKSWSLDSLYREIYLSPPPPGGEEKVNGPPMRRNERQPKKKESGLNEDLKVSRLGFWWRGEEGKAGSPFSTVGGPRPHSRNRLQNVLFTWFEGAPFQQGLLLLILILLRLSLFTRSNSVFSHLFFPFLSFFRSFFSSSSRTSFLNRRSTEEVSRCKVRFRDDFRDKCYCCIVWPRFEERGDSGCRLMICWDEFRKFLTVQGLCCCYQFPRTEKEIVNCIASLNNRSLSEQIRRFIEN